MFRGGAFIITIILSSLLGYGTAYAVDFDSRDTRVDLPILSIPNNAVNPKMSADENGHAYVVWSDNRGGSPNIYTNTYFPDAGWQPRATPLSTGFPRAQDTTIGDATAPEVCSDSSGHVYVVWVDDRAVKAGTGRRDLYFRYSIDYGLSWYPEFTDERIDSDNPGIGDSVTPRIACDENGNIYVVWDDDRNTAGIYEVYFRSLHVDFSIHPSFGNPVTFYQTPELRLNTGIDAGIASAVGPAISTDKAGHVYVSWLDMRIIPDEGIYPGIFFNVSSSHGTKWAAESIRIDRTPVGGDILFSSPVISSDSGGRVYIAWTDTAGRALRDDIYSPDGTGDVYFNHSVNFGADWQDDDTRIDTPDILAEVVRLNIASNNKGIVAIVWTDNRGATKVSDPNYNIFFNHSENFGRSFVDTARNTRLDSAIPIGESSATSPVVQIDNAGNVFVAWTDTLAETSNVFFNFSVGKGQASTWQTPHLRLDYSDPVGDSINPVMAIDNKSHIYVVWQDDRSALVEGQYNIFFIAGFLDIQTLLIAGQRLGEACFIATAAYGSPFERHVEALREFRDQYLLTNRAGRWFVSTYYRLSPPAAYFIAKHDYLRLLVRIMLLPAVGAAWFFVHATLLQKLAIGFFAVFVLSLASISKLKT